MFLLAIIMMWNFVVTFCVLLRLYLSKKFCVEELNNTIDSFFQVAHMEKDLLLYKLKMTGGGI